MEFDWFLVRGGRRSDCRRSDRRAPRTNSGTGQLAVQVVIGVGLVSFQSIPGDRLRWPA